MDERIMDERIDRDSWRSLSDLERRTRWLELQVVTLAEAVRTLITGLDDEATKQRDHGDIQHARDLLRIAESMPHPERLP
ncbi:MAG TPA: hypothetical protein VH912_21970 [Streptosporangiaceae bacterium]|jgi:hypothetical protein